MKNYVIEFVRKCIRFAIRNKLYFLLKVLFTAMIKQYNEDGSYNRVVKKNLNSKVTVLALNPDQFRGDLEVLAKEQDFNILRIHVGWERIVESAFYPPSANALHYYKPDGDEVIIRAQKECREFLRNLLLYVYKKIPVDCIIISNVRFIEDLDWCFVSRELGVKVILMFREGLMMYERVYDSTVGRHTKFGKFQGDHIIAHNNVSKKMFIEAKFASPDSISVKGILRMDKYIKMIKSSEKMNASKKINLSRFKIVLFYFGYDKDNLGKETEFGYSPPGVPYEIYRDTNLALLYLAQDNPQIDIVLKPKPKDIQSGQFKQLVEREGLNLSQIPNFSVQPDVNVHELILESDIIIGLQTTAILEAAIAKKCIILPFFKKFRESEWSARFGYRQYLDLFLVADDRNDLRHLIQKNIGQYEPSDDVQVKRNDLFEEYLSSLKGDAAKQYANTIKSIVGR